MRIDSVRELKAALQQSVVVPLATSNVVRSFGMRAQLMSELAATPPTIALGVARRGENDFALAVRIQKRGLENSPQVESIKQQARGEVDVRYIGSVVKFARKAAGVPWQQKRNRPLKIGTSIGHHKITAGTLGCFVKERSTGAVLVLSNNHVLANENRARTGDVILQPGAFDGGQNPADKVGELLRYVRLKKSGVNIVDAAVATINSGLKYDARTITEVGKLAGLGEPAVKVSEKVAKFGRTTGATHGCVTAFEIDNVMVQYDNGTLQFDNQIEIEGDGSRPFSQGGDSGSLIVDEECRAVALLFSGGDQGGSNGQGLTYANPIDHMLEALKVDLYFD